MTESSMTGRRGSQPVDNIHPPVLAIPPGHHPAISCPDWCTDTYEYHFGELGELEGFVIHHSAPRQWVWHSRSAYPDGTIDLGEAPTVWLEAPQGLTIEEAEGLARNLMAAVEEARA